MGILSARLAVLVCLGVVLPISPPVEAAYLYGGHSMEKHASSPYAPHSPASFGGSATSHGHPGQDHGDAALRFPPLLRRHRIHDHKKVHDHANDNVVQVRSAFARSRYRRGPESHNRRSSVYVPGEHGSTYIVTRTPSKASGNGYAGASHPHNRRQVDENNLALGRIDIMGAAQSSNSSQRLASLTIDSTPIDWSSGQGSAKAFPLNASTTNQTQFMMVPTDDSNAEGNKHVTLATQFFDPTSAEMVMYCATYDSDPGTPSALLMTPCTGTAQSVTPSNDVADPCADDENDASSSNTHQSQIFSYDPSSGKIEPISTGSASSDGSGSSTDASTPCTGQKLRRDTTSPSTTSSSAKLSSTTSTSTPTASASQHAQNVTLVYVAGALEVPAPSPTSSSNTAAAAVVTTTITTTVVATVTTSDTPTRSATPARAAASLSTPSAPSPSTIPASSASTITTRSSLSHLSSTASASTTIAPANAAESLEVEIVGVSTTASSLSTSATTTGTATTTTTSSRSGSVSPTLNAAAVASSLANKMARQRREAYTAR